MTRDTESAELAKVETWLRSLEGSTVRFKDARHLRAIGEALTAVENAEDALARAIADARAAGDSWSAIAMMLGTSKQAAHRRFGQKVG
jgi:hypothetical protein